MNQETVRTKKKGKYLLLVMAIMAFSLFSSEADVEGQRQVVTRPNQQDYRILLRQYKFDPLIKQPEIPQELRIAEPPKEAAYYIVQFTKSLMKEERAEIQGRYGLRLTEYIPNFAFLEYVNPQVLEALSKHSLFRSKTIYQPAFKISPGIGQLKFVTPERKAMKGLLLRALLHLDESPSALVEVLKTARASDIKVIDDRKNKGAIRVNFVLPSKEALPQIVRLKEVRWIEEIPEINVDNNNTAGTIQSGTPGVTPIWNQGLNGEGQIIGVIDTGPPDVNHCMFQDPTDNTIRLAHRKVVGLRNSSGVAAGTHGTFVSGIAIGDDSNNPGTGATRGMAWASRMTFGYSGDLNSTSLFNYLIAASLDGASIHTNSWHEEPNPQYNQTAADVDTFVWNNEDNLVLGSSGNSGEAIGPPGTAKNAICVSASQRDPNEMNFGDGNNGPTPDGRRKPEIFAPGCSITSAEVGTACTIALDSTIYGFGPICATSWATPAVAGVASLVRQYYTEGWYPTGTKQPHHAFIPSGALLKATVLNSTIDMTGIAGYPGNQEGWGLIRLDNVLFPPGSIRNLRVWDYRNAGGLYTGQSRTHHINVDTNTQPLRVTLVWTEPPASSNSSAPVVNDLDLTVTSPAGAQTFLGNVFAGGVSTTGGTADALNNVEMVLVNNPAPGDWTITITGTSVNVGNPAQGYALVVTADMPEPPIPTGTQDTLVVRVKFNDIAYEPPLPNLQNLMTDVVGYFNAITYSQATVLPEFRGPITLDQPKDYYYHPSRNLLIELTQEVVDKLVAADPNVFDKGTAAEADDIDRMIIVTNDVNFTGDWATTGPWPYDMPGGFNRPISVSVQSYANIDARFTHGLGHQFGLVDLYAYPGVIFPRSYVDEWCNMGGLFNNVHFLVWNKNRAQWLTTHGSTIEYIPRPAAGSSTAQTYELFNQESTLTNRKAVAIGLTQGAATLATEDVFYYIEARNNTLGGYDDNLPASGVLIYYVNELIPQGEGPVILRDKNPGTATLADAAFAVGDSYTIPGTGITIDVLAPTGGADYNIRVTYAPPATDYNVFITKGDTIGGTFYSYFSPDIWIDSPKNGWNLGGGPPPNDQRENPVVNMVNRIYARIHNNGPGIAYDFDVRFRVSEPYHTVGGEADFNRFVGIKHVDSLNRTEGAVPPATPLIVYVEWTPDDDGDPHSCVWVDLINLVGTDTNQYDNGAQENLNEVTSLTASPYHSITYSYTLKNSFDQQALFYFRAQDVPSGWTVTLNPEKILLNPGERVEGKATITPPPEAKLCTSRRIQITSWTPRGDTLIPVGGGVVQVDLRNPGRLIYEAIVEPCRRVDPKKSGVIVAPGAICYAIKTQGCTDPPQPNQEIFIKYTDPLGNPVYHTVMTDSAGCFEDFFVGASGGAWQVDVEFPGNDCIGPIEPPTQVVVVPPAPPKPVRGLGYSFHLGMNFPAGKFTEEYDPGPSLTFDLEYSLKDNLSILGLLGFHYFHGIENDLSWTNLSLNARFYFPLVGWRWYVSGGPGSYMPNHGTRKFGVNLGTGLNFPIQPHLSLDVGADYHLVDPSGDRRVFFDVKMGLIFKF